MAWLWIAESPLSVRFCTVTTRTPYTEGELGRCGSEGNALPFTFFGSSEELVGRLGSHPWKSSGLEPLENLNNKACVFVLGVDELVRLRRPFIRRGHSLRPGVSPDG